MLDDIPVFVAVAREGSFTAAARALRVSVSQVSRRVQALEEALGVRLVERTTRSVRLTRVGHDYLERVAPLLDGLDDAARAAASEQAEAKGTLRVTLPTALGERHLMRAVASFCSAHPAVTVETSLTDRIVDLFSEGFDVAIRGGQVLDPSLVARKLVPFRGVLAASPAYLERHGTPRSPHDLAHHACLINSGLRSMPGWWFEVDGEPVVASVDGPLSSDNGRALVVAAIAGQGIVYEPEFLVDDALTTGSLVPLLTRLVPYSGGLFAVYPNRRHLPVRVRLFIDHMAEFLSPPPWTRCPERTGTA